jgi:hypothetical protein
MPTKWEFTKKTKADLQKSMEYFMHPEDLPSLNPDVFKKVTIKDNQDNAVTFDMDLRMMGRDLHTFSKQTLDMNARTMTAQVLDGDSKGSVMVVSFNELPDKSGTEVKYSASLELGALGFLAKGASKSMWEKTADATIQQLDSR